MKQGNGEMLNFVLAVAALLMGSVILSLVYEGIAGNESFSLPLANILLVVVVGGILYWYFGFRSTVIILGLYAVWAVVGGLIERRS